MFGMELYEFLSFFRQVGLVLAGAASMWALVFLWRARRSSDNEKRAVLENVANRLFIAFSVGFLLASFSWILLWNTWPVLAHEGITLYPTAQEYRDAFMATLHLHVIWIILTAAAVVFKLFRRETFARYLPYFFAVQFVVVSILVSFYAWTGNFFGNEQIFFFFHGFHSIFTLGTVLTLDFIALTSRNSLKIQKHVFPFFPAISKIIFIGLGLDFLSVYLVFDDAIELVPRFFMAQTAVGILIINGVFLSGPLTRRILNKLKEGKMLAGKWKIAAGISGVISVVSWTTITFIDYFPNMTFSYTQLLAGYLFVICGGIVVHFIIEWFDSRHKTEDKKEEIQAKPI